MIEISDGRERLLDIPLDFSRGHGRAQTDKENGQDYNNSKNSEERQGAPAKSVLGTFHRYSVPSPGDTYDSEKNRFQVSFRLGDFGAGIQPGYTFGYLNPQGRLDSYFD